MKLQWTIVASSLAVAAYACGAGDNTNVEPAFDGGIMPDGASGGPEDASGTDSTTRDAAAMGTDAAGAEDASAADSGVHDASTGLDAAGGADAASLLTVAGLVLWLRGDLGTRVQNVSDTSIASWADESGNGNDAVPGTAGQQPTLTLNGLATLPSLNFRSRPGSTVGCMLVLKDSPSLRWGTGDFLIETVARFDNTPSADTTTEAQVGFGTLYSKSDDVHPGVSFLANTRPNGGSAGGTGLDLFTDTLTDTSITTAYNDGKGHLFAAQRVGTTLSLRVDGAQVSTKTVTAADLDAVGVIARLGASSDATTARLDGDVSEVIAVKGTLAPTDLGVVEHYLLTKYGL